MSEFELQALFSPAERSVDVYFATGASSFILLSAATHIGMVSSSNAPPGLQYAVALAIASVASTSALEGEDDTRMMPALAFVQRLVAPALNCEALLWILRCSGRREHCVAWPFALSLFAGGEVLIRPWS